MFPAVKLGVVILPASVYGLLPFAKSVNGVTGTTSSAFCGFVADRCVRAGKRRLPPWDRVSARLYLLVNIRSSESRA